jgi:hypothetical protein
MLSIAKIEKEKIKKKRNTAKTVCTSYKAQVINLPFTVSGWEIAKSSKR